MSKKLTILSFSVIAIAAAQSSIGQNLVVNGGFETGNLSGWTLTPAPVGSDQSVGGPAHTGNYAWEAGAVGGLDDYISQDLATTTGHEYQISYWLDTETGSDNQQGYYNAVSMFGAVTMQNISPPATGGSFPYTQFTFDEVATGPSTTLSFGIQALHGWFELDDVSVVDEGAVAAPDATTTSTLLSLTVLGFGALRRKMH